MVTTIPVPSPHSNTTIPIVTVIPTSNPFANTTVGAPSTTPMIYGTGSASTVTGFTTISTGLPRGPSATTSAPGTAFTGAAMSNKVGLVGLAAGLLAAAFV